MSEQNKPMTAEEMLKNIIDDYYKDVPKGMRTDFQMLPDDPKRLIAAEAMKQYAAQQTASLTEKVKELEEGMIRGYKVGTMAYIPFERIAWKDARIAELEENYRQLAEDRDDLKSKVDVMSTAQGNIVRELEAVKKERDDATKYMEHTVNNRTQVVGELKTQLSEVTRQRDEWENFKCQLAAYLMECNYKCTGAEVSDFIDEFSPRISSGETKPVREKERNECEQERDRAIWLLSRYLEYAESGCIQGMEDDELSEETRNFLNGNALPVSPWISVEDRLPEKKGYYIAMCLAPYKEPGLIHYHKNTGWQNGFYECSHWMPLPAPPESLTDKK